MRHLCLNLYNKLYSEKQTKDLSSGTNFYTYLEGTEVTVSTHTVKENTVALIETIHLFVCITGGFESNFHLISHMLTAFSIQKLTASENCVPLVSVFNQHLG
jgi:hypothetical protein